ncbi:assimilatory nitrate reductase electron transfer subunit [Saccharopolyspora erythraea NRRL 2338]|uniref:Assimilatory nitrite reductase large subunit n=2 Tax=Saccharopolyspora erythraea TaxID=1836 RepID=A4FG97_SACEN|nr:FAD-dependent oxidoreductase [Saccharopolyspora erythraea]EQD81397.1 ferredoxin [Saccharopolyspora erythraea D]PFG96777.1 assimilatory nitrate reductase electron transfer subunit [Saccharopolyspora erythraea NRRL 2338]QRK87023.1 NAD(P)/FAD-dependent oxidoreductase [Saccharopolyspora erythraea]CAM03072.1 assimilatory nitrite reductase large subunit [Saccharopolyspora erythraea NRRL 2338]
MSRIVVVGNGPAAHRFTERMRHHGHSGPITVLGAESHAAYNRVLLGSVLDGSLTADGIALPPLDADVRLGVSATGIDRARREVHTDTGGVHHYDELVLATGARPRVPDVPGLRDGGSVRTLRTLADCAELPRGRVAVLGGGILGVEAARALAGRGADVVLVHPGRYPMDRQLDATAGKLLAERLGTLGVETRLERKAVERQPGKLVLDDGEVLLADEVVVCAGVEPETGLAQHAGLRVAHGVVVDDGMATSDPNIHAVGDCAEHGGTVSGLIASAWEQAEALAQRLTGARGRYRGTKTVTRLKARGIDLVSIGSREALASLDAEVVTLSDPARGRYARIALADERVAGAVLFGFPQAIASVTQLHDGDLPVPSDRLGLLLGTAAATRATPVELPDDAVVCRCNNVTKKALTTAWHGGARSVADIAQATRATTGCGGCADDVRRICGSLRTRTEEQQEGAA